MSVANGSGATLSGTANGPVVIGSTTIPVAGAFNPGAAVNGLPANFITPINFTGTTNGTNIITNVSSTVGLQVGQAIYGADVAIAGGPVAPGPPVIAAYQRLGANSVLPIYNGLDPETHYLVPPDGQLAADLTFIGHRLPDREARVE